MDVVMPLVGVVVGGMLVFLGDSLRRRAEWARAQARLLLDAGTTVMAVCNRTVGDLIEAREHGDTQIPLHAGSGLRREASARFFAVPGSEALRPEFTALMKAHARLRRAAATDSGWDDQLTDYEQALLAFLIELRATVRRGRVAADPPPSPALVMDASTYAISAGFLPPDDHKDPSAPPPGISSSDQSTQRNERPTAPS